ncbi:MAG: acyl-CoA thioesterase [Solirubrobacterales bacterium]
MSAYPYEVSIPTRWMDADAYGHVNNAEYFSFFDTAVSRWLVEQGGRDLAADATIGLCVESSCSYAAPVTFPEEVTAGVRVGRIGRSSVRYELELRTGRSADAVASGSFVHVYVDRASRRPVPIPGSLRDRLESLVPA